MLVILTVFLYLDACFTLSPLDSADNRPLSVRCEVQISTAMHIINLIRQLSHQTFNLIGNVQPDIHAPIRVDGDGLQQLD